MTTTSVKCDVFYIAEPIEDVTLDAVRVPLRRLYTVQAPEGKVSVGDHVGKFVGYVPKDKLVTVQSAIVVHDECASEQSLRDRLADLYARYDFVRITQKPPIFSRSGTYAFFCAKFE